MKTFLVSSIAILVGDQLSKAIAKLALQSSAPVEIIDSLVRFKFVCNPGSAFGFFQGGRYLLVGISIAAVVVILYLIKTRRYAFRGSNTAFGLVFGGALGNLVDRLFRVGVIDFIDIGIGAVRWPTFNIADAGVTIGVLYLVFAVLLLNRNASVGDAAAGNE